MIHASEALRLPSAQLTEDENKMVTAILDEIDTGVRTNVRRNGFEFKTNCTSAPAIFEVTQVLQDGGWIVNCQPILKHPRIQGGMTTHEGFTLVCAPSREAVLAARQALQ